MGLTVSGQETLSLTSQLLLNGQPSTLSTAEQQQQSPHQPAILRSRSQKPKERQKVLRIGFASWLTGKVWLLGINRAESGWDVCLRTLNIVPRDAPIFAACWDGDFEHVRRLLTSGNASIYDTAPREIFYLETTPLQVR